MTLFLSTLAKRGTKRAAIRLPLARSQSTLMIEDDIMDTSSSCTEKRPIYVAATRQHVGKTSTSLALMSGLQKRFDLVGFMKPVGQVCLPVWEEDLQREIRADKDVVVMRQHFGLDPLPYRYMSPVLIPAGYTRNYLDGKICEDKHEELVREAYENIAQSSDVVLCEGTGHAAVGSIVGKSTVVVPKQELERRVHCE